VRFNPSDFSDYGDGHTHSERSAQLMLTQYAPGMNYGDTGYGEYGNALVSTVISAGSQLIGTGVGMHLQGKQAKGEQEHGRKMGKQAIRQAELAAEAALAQADAEAAKTQATLAVAAYAAGAVTLLGVMGIGTWYFLKRAK
jgi:hypothetical protein